MSMALSIGLISLIIFGNIENLILASQGVVYGIYIEFIGGLAIFILGIQSMLEAVRG